MNLALIMVNITPNSSYLPQLDGLRAFAVGMVMVHHWVPGQWTIGVPWGLVGVYIFFVLSGYLITGILLKSKRSVADGFRPGKVLFRFYIRRFVRIFPLYYGVLFVAAILNIPNVRDTWVWTTTYLTNFYMFQGQDWAGAVTHFWTLAVEEHFYVFWPWLVLFLPASKLGRYMFFVATVGFFFGPFASLVFPHIRLWPVLTFVAMGPLALGGILSMVDAHGKNRKRFANLLAIVGMPPFAVVVMVEALCEPTPMTNALRSSAFMLVAVWIVNWVVSMEHGFFYRVFTLRILVWLGKISYGIYIYHVFVAEIVSDVLRRNGLFEQLHWVVLVLSYGLITVAVSSLSWIFFERPINSLKTLFPYHDKKLQSNTSV